MSFWTWIPPLTPNIKRNHNVFWKPHGIFIYLVWHLKVLNFWMCLRFVFDYHLGTTQANTWLVWPKQLGPGFLFNNLYPKGDEKNKGVKWCEGISKSKKLPKTYFMYHPMHQKAKHPSPSITNIIWLFVSFVANNNYNFLNFHFYFALRF